MSSDSRRIRHEAQSKPKFSDEKPTESSGKNGDLVYVRSGDGIEEFVKDEGRWLSLSTGRPSDEKAYISRVSSRRGGGGTATSASSSSGTSGNHNLLSNLNDDDHSQYVHITSNRTVSAVHTYSSNLIFSGNPNFTGTPTFSGIDINGGDIASGTVVNKSPVITLAGDLGGNLTLSNLAGGTLTATIQPNSVALTTDTTGNYMTNVTGNSQVSVSHSQGEGSTASFSIAGDSIGDTQLAYNTGQHLTTSSNPTFDALTTTTLNTGNGANELYAMNQNVKTDSNVTFGDIIVDGDDITSNPFTSGFVGSGWKIDNTAHAEFASASIRGTLSVYELLLQQLRATNGSVLITAVAKVEGISGNDITFEDPSDNGVCPFHDNDIVMVQRADLTGTSGADNGGGTLEIIRRLVRRVTSVSGRTITVTRDGDLPTDTGSFGVGDDVVRIGNTTNTNRDAILYLSADDSKAPYIVIKDGVNSWANWGSASTEKARLGRLDGITDTDAGLSGSQSNTYGLYSDNVHLKGHIFATSGKIGGISMASSKIYTGTGTHGNGNTGFYIDSSSNFSLGSKLTWNGSVLAIDGGGTFSGALSAASGTFSGALSAATGTFAGALSAATGTFSGTVSIGGVNLDATNTFNSNTTAANVGLGNVDNTSAANIQAGTTKANVGLSNVDNDSTSSIQSGTTKANVGLGNVDNTSDTTVLGTAATAANNATKTAGYVGGWLINSTSILGIADGSAQIVLTASGNIASQKWSINRDGSASFADGGITFEAGGDITSNTFLLERTRLFGAGEDGTVVLYANSTDATYKVDYEVNSQHGVRIITRSGNTWSMQGDCYFDTLTLSASAGALVLDTNGFRLFVKNTLTIASGCYISCNGNQPSGWDDGDAYGGGSTNGTLSRGAQGHSGGSIGGGTGNGGEGGRGGAAGGGGGIVFISARIISNSGYIHAKGGNGHAGQQGGSE